MTTTVTLLADRRVLRDYGCSGLLHAKATVIRWKILVMQLLPLLRGFLPADKHMVTCAPGAKSHGVNSTLEVCRKAEFLCERLGNCGVVVLPRVVGGPEGCPEGTRR